MTQPEFSYPITRGTIFVEEVNKLLHSMGDDNMLAMNPATLGPDFNKTIEELHRDGKDLSAPSVLMVTTLRLSDELKEKRQQSPSEYFVIEQTRLTFLTEIAEYLSSHPKAQSEFAKITGLTHLSN